MRSPVLAFARAATLTTSLMGLTGCAVVPFSGGNLYIAGPFFYSVPEKKVDYPDEPGSVKKQAPPQPIAY